MLEVNNIYLGDAYELVKYIDNKSIDLIITDPPYDLQCNGGTGWTFSDNFVATLSEIQEKKLNLSVDFKILDEFMRVLKKPNIYIRCNKKQIPGYIEYFVKKKKCNFEIISWHKTNAMPLMGGTYLSDSEYCLYFFKKVKQNSTYESAKTHYELPINKTDKKLYNHPTIKPIEIIRNFIINSSKKGDVILDPFLGSGTTAVAAKVLERKYIGIEIDRKYFEIANDRVKGITQLEKNLGYEQMKLF